MCCRCEGYGFDCTWSAKRRRAFRTGETRAAVPVSDEWQYRSPASGGDSRGSSLQEQFPAYSRALRSYEALIQEIRANLDSSRQAALDFSLQDIRRLLPQEPKDEQPTCDGPEATGILGMPAAPSPTYVGKASDIHFIHSIRQCVHGHRDLTGEDTSPQDSHQSRVLESSTVLKHPLLFPAPAEADQFLDVYLSTIHIAYPFLSKQVLLDAFRRYQKGEAHAAEFRPWLAVLSTSHSAPHSCSLITRSSSPFPAPNWTASPTTWRWTVIVY